MYQSRLITSLFLIIYLSKFHRVHFALLGPSGCGKTTVLRLIAGLDSVDTGTIHLGENNITNQPIYLRRINTVFQQYALFPHLSVFENVAYSLRIKKISEPIIREKVFAVLKSVRLAGREFKPIHSLSGGQQQRVALARAMVNEPDVLLFDEPLAALDLNLREQMLLELIELQDKIKTTFVYVTHDQTEALTVADKMAIMNEDGKIEQIGSPKEIYEFPATRFVANFVGKTNIVEGILKEENGALCIEIADLGNFAVYSPMRKLWMSNGNRVYLSLRPEKIFISKKNMQDLQIISLLKLLILFTMDALRNIWWL